MQSPCAHHVSPRAEHIANLTLSRCQRLSQGTGARRGLFARPVWPRHTLLWHNYQCASRKPVPPFPPSLRHHVSPRAEKIANLTPSRCQRLSQGAGAHRRLFARPAWPRRKLLWHAYQRASRQVKLILSPKQRAKPAASRTRTCTNAAVCIASGECPPRF